MFNVVYHCIVRVAFSGGLPFDFKQVFSETAMAAKRLGEVECDISVFSVTSSGDVSITNDFVHSPVAVVANYCDQRR